ncbi:hypothetical protein F5Y18DRAFT_425094 [Xylariaceae sp. FL1019]|nr:hypothetical protein F5Y18DRAFT_425094 [Xylariaceae sp. FL1019]
MSLPTSSQNSRKPRKAAQMQRTVKRNSGRREREMQLDVDFAEHYSDGEIDADVVIGQNGSKVKARGDHQMQSASEGRGKGKEVVTADHEPLKTTAVRNTEGSDLSVLPDHPQKAPVEQHVEHPMQARDGLSTNRYAPLANPVDHLQKAIDVAVIIEDIRRPHAELFDPSSISDNSGEGNGLFVYDHKPLETESPDDKCTTICPSPRRITASPEAPEKAPPSPEFNWEREYREHIATSWPEETTEEIRIRRRLANAGCYSAPGPRR